MTQLLCELKICIGRFWTLHGRRSLRASSRFSKVRAFFLGACFQLLCMHAGVAWAQQRIAYHGVPIDVDRLEPVAPRAVQVAVGGDTFVVPEVNAGREVIKHIVDSHGELAPSLIAPIALQAARNSDLELLRPLIDSALRRPEVTIFDDEDVWHELSATESGRVAVLQALRGQDGTYVLRRACVSLFSLHEGGTHTSDGVLADTIRRWADRCLRLAASQALDELFTADMKVQPSFESSTTWRLIDMNASSQSIGVKDFRHHIGVVRELIQTSNPYGFATELSTIRELAEKLGVKSEPLSTQALSDIFVQRASEAGKFDVVLKYLPSLDLTHRNPALHESVVRSLDSISVHDALGAVSADVVKAVGVFVEKDEEVAVRAQSMIKRVIDQLLTQNKVESAYVFVSMWWQSPYSASPTFQKSAVHVIDALLRIGASGKALELSSRKGAAFGLFLRVRLQLARMGLTDWRVAAVLIVLLVAPGIVVKRLAVGARNPRGKMHRGFGNIDVARSGLQGPSSSFSDDLIQSLAVFGLTPGASLHDIKNAYRRAAKKCHPDRKGGSGVEGNTDFIALTKQYQKLLALYEHESDV